MFNHPPHHPLTDFALGQPVCVARGLKKSGLSKGEAFKIIGFVEYDGQTLLHLQNVAHPSVAVAAKDLCFPGEV
jgi:hypothetical protein